LEKWKWAILIVYYILFLDFVYYVVILDGGSSAVMASIAFFVAPVLVILCGRYASSRKPTAAPARMPAQPPPPPPEMVPAWPTVESRTQGQAVKTEGLREVMMIKQGPSADQQYIKEVLQALHPELAGMDLTVHTKTSGNFAPDEIYVITTLMLEKGKDFDISGKTVFQQYRDKQGHQGYLVFVYE
jgi:hypothetical protein